jgi:predicted transcriptional regulator
MTAAMPRRILLWGFRPAESVHALGTLERDVVDAVWRRGESSVHQVRAELGRAVAYTTVMTVLDRLFKKGILERQRSGRAYVYSAVASPEQLQSSVAIGLLDRLLGRGRDVASPVLSNLVDTVGDRDGQLLDELDRLVREKRRILKRKEKG